MADWHLWLPPALTKRRFRIYMAGHLVSVIGGWIQQVALAWLVFRLTSSIFLLGCHGLPAQHLLSAARAARRARRRPAAAPAALIGIDLVLAACAVLLAVMVLPACTTSMPISASPR